MLYAWFVHAISDQIEGGEEGEFAPHWLMSSHYWSTKWLSRGGEDYFPPTGQWSLIRDSVLGHNQHQHGKSAEDVFMDKPGAICFLKIHTGNTAIFTNLWMTIIMTSENCEK